MQISLSTGQSIPSLNTYWRMQNNCSSSDRFITVQCCILALSVLFFNVYYKQQPATLKNKPFQTVARCAIILHTPVRVCNVCMYTIHYPGCTETGQGSCMAVWNNVCMHACVHVCIYNITLNTHFALRTKW
jgi:hypothetical protein